MSGRVFVLSCLVAISGSMYSQVGVKTENPKGVFHIDAKSDNSTTPTAAQLANDVIVDENGKTGIGMMPVASDASKLQVNGPATIVNAGETPIDGIGFVLATKDGTGQAKWTKNISITPTIIGVLGHNGPAGQTNSDGSVAVPPHPYTDKQWYPLPPYDTYYKNGYQGKVQDTRVWTGAFITLPPGLWIIQSNILLYAERPDTRVCTLDSRWIRLMWSDEPFETPGQAIDNDHDFSPDILSGRMVSGAIPYGGMFGLAVGTTLMHNKGTTNKTYFLNVCYPTYVCGNWYRLGSAQWSENGIVAFPVTSGED